MLWQSFKLHQKRMRDAGRSSYEYEDDDEADRGPQDEQQEGAGRVQGKEGESFLEWQGDQPDLVPDLYTDVVDPSEEQLDAW